KPYNITNSHLNHNELDLYVDREYESHKTSSSKITREREIKIRPYIDTIWNYNSSILDKKLKCYGFSLLESTDLASIRKIINQRYDAQRKIIYNSEDSYIPLKDRYREFFKNGGFRGLTSFRGHFMPGSEGTDCLLNRMLGYYANCAAYTYYRLLQSNHSMTKKEFLDTCIDPSVAKLLGTLNSFVFIAVER